MGVNDTSGPADLRVATYTMEVNTIEDGPSYSSTYVLNP
jgi:hypothetical protein